MDEVSNTIILTLHMEVKKLKTNQVSEFKTLVEIFSIAFENDEQISDDGHLGKLLSNPNFMVFVVCNETKIVGGLSIYILDRYYQTKPLAYIYDVAIHPAYQGQGFGKALISEVCKYCEANGFEDAYVEAESDDDDAVNFYRKTQYSNELNATHFTYTFNKTH